jgi:hypothetical protein
MAGEPGAFIWMVGPSLENGLIPTRIFPGSAVAVTLPLAVLIFPGRGQT